MSVLQRFAIFVLLAVGGCTLIDQRTFNPEAGKAPVVPPASAPLIVAPTDPRALFTLRPPATLDAAAQRSLAAVVQGAIIRKPSIFFGVVAIVPTADADTTQAAAVARAVITAGVPAGRVRLRAEIGSPAETRVYPE